jgi:hypothetical protein
MTIEQICEKYQIKNYTINDDGTIDVDGYVDLIDEELFKLPLTFNKVTGYFDCSWNRLTSLKGCPKWVGTDFYCHDNKLTSLEYDPEYVGGSYKCSFNKLTTLEGCPEYIPGSFFCGHNELTSFEYSPKQIDGNYMCLGNNIYSLDGITEKIGKSFYCSGNPIGSIFDDVDQFFIHAFNFYKIIKSDTVNLKRLKYVMDLYDKPIDLEEIQKYYKLV